MRRVRLVPNRARELGPMAMFLSVAAGAAIGWVITLVIDGKNLDRWFVAACALSGFFVAGAIARGPRWEQRQIAIGIAAFLIAWALVRNWLISALFMLGLVVMVVRRARLERDPPDHWKPKGQADHDGESLEDPPG